MRRLFAAFVRLLAGCIQQSDTRTFYLHEDGKVDFVLLFDDVHSSQSGGKGKEEEAGWLADFKRKSTPELKRLKAAHAKELKARLLRDRVPFSTVVTGSFESVRDLGVFLELSPTDPKNKIEFAVSGGTRTFSIHSENEKAASAKAEQKSKEESDAEHRIFWRFVPVGGTVTAAKACLVSEDKTSCLMDLSEIWRQQKEGSGAFDVSLTWSLPSPRP